jgi:hypothetical protein
MNINDKRVLVAAAIVVAALVCAGASFAATKLSGHGHHMPPPQRGGFGLPGGPMRGSHDDLAATATYLGISQTTLRTDLQSGKSLAQIANATSGKSASGLIAALVSAEKANLAAQVKAGRLTQAQADAGSKNLQARITGLVNGAFPAPRGGGRFTPGPA